MQQHVDPSTQILKLITILNQKGQEVVDKKPAIFNEIIKITKQVFEGKQDSQQIQRLQQDDFILWARNQLQDSKAQIRQYAIKFLRYLITDQKILGIYRQKGVHYFIARSLQRDCKPSTKNEGTNRQQQQPQYIQQEVLQALKFSNKWLEKLGGCQNQNLTTTSKFPKILGNALVAMAESCEEQLKRYAIITLKAFALNAPEMCSWCGGIRILIENAIECSLSEISDQIVWTLLYLLNEPSARTTIRMYLDLSKWFSIFTEIDPPIDQAKNDKNRVVINKFESNLQLAKKAIITVLKSWQGLIYLGDERQALKSLIQVLRQPIKPAIRNSIYDILRSLLQLGNKENVGVSVVNRQQQQDGFIGEYKINNLLNNYLVMLVQVLLDCDLFKILVELSGLPDQEVSGPAQTFLKELSSLMFNLIPDCHKYTDFLIAAANQNDPFLQDLKSWSSEIVNTMGNYAFDNTNKKGRNQISKFLYQCESLYLTTQLGLPTHKINNETVGIIRGQIEQEADQNKFETLLSKSYVLEKKEDNSKWNWNYILDLLENYLYDESRYQETIKNRFLKNLLTYYFPSNMQFCKMDWKPDFIQAKCGYLLLKLLLRDKVGREIISSQTGGYLGIAKSYIQDLISLLKADNSQILGLKSSVDQNAQRHAAQYLLNPEQYSQKMIREYISWIGLFSCSKSGQTILENTGIFTILKDYILESGIRDHLLIHLIHSFDYGKQSQARVFFSNCLENGSNTLIKACLDFIRLLYRSELHDFNIWAIDLLINCLNKTDDIGLKALSVIEEVTQDIENANRFLEKVDIHRLLQLCQKCESQLIIMLLSHKKGFEKIYKDLNEYLLNEIERWKQSECENYIEKVEKVMCDALEFVQSVEQSYSFKFPLLQNNNENPNASIGFVYKMPWSMLLNCELGSEGNELAYLNVTIDYPGTTNLFILVGKSERFIQFHTNNPFVLKLQINVGKIFVDTQFKEVTEPYLIRCDANDKRNKSYVKDNQLIIEKNGILFIFDQFDSTLRLNQIKVYVRLGETKNNTIKMPAHIFGELAFTEAGFNLLRNYIDYFVQSIRSADVSFQQKRSALWAIGHIGQSKYGIRLIRELGLIQDLVKMAEQYPVLSLRGTCLYTLNLICTTSMGRKELEKFQWISHLNCNSGWLCIPKNIYQFFYIRVSLQESHRCYWALQEDIWDKYSKFQSYFKMNQTQKKIIDTISLMSNSITYKEADKELSILRNSKPECFQDVDLFHLILMMITFYQFSAQAKNRIFSNFDRIFTYQTINIIIEHPIYQQLQCQEPLII
ncbi:unnamed protein product [Paramecium pentaurelia]|uniref:Uncharacterized protein n=1 Tax=Paramecium pentaurelia TaxID=43138 RepID=A0A8S1SGX9_9CILI|nr:unnamed protein product [Paramecium pentaurelia]